MLGGDYFSGERMFNFTEGALKSIADNTQEPINIRTDKVHNLQVMVNTTNGLNSLFLGYPLSAINDLSDPTILSKCANVAELGQNISAVAVSSASDNTSYCFIVAQGAIRVSDIGDISHAIITADTWYLPQRYRVDLIEWAAVFIDPPVNSMTMIEVQCGAPSNLSETPNWHMGMNKLSNVTWQGTACQGVITNLFPIFNFTGEGSTNIFAKLVASSTPEEVVRQITTSPNSLQVAIAPNSANISICSSHPIFVALNMIGGSNNLVSTYPSSLNSQSLPDSSSCNPGIDSSASIFFSNMLDNNTYCMVASDGFIFVEDALEWKETYIYSSTLTVPFRYNIKLLQWQGVYFLAFSNQSAVVVHCNEPNVTNGLAWRIGRNTTASSSGTVEGAIVWNSASCIGVTSDIFPHITFAGNGTTNVTILVDQAFSPVNITLLTLALQTSYPYAFISSDGTQVVKLNMTIESATTNLILDREPSQAFIPVVQATSTANIEALRRSPITLQGELEFVVSTATMKTVSYILKLHYFMLFTFLNHKANLQ